MFDPKHNAHNNYFSVEGDLAAGWDGMPANVTVLNWNLDRLTRFAAVVFRPQCKTTYRTPADHRRLL